MYIYIIIILLKEMEKCQNVWHDVQNYVDERKRQIIYYYSLCSSLYQKKKINKRKNNNNNEYI